MQAEERTTLDRLVEELDDGRARAPRLWGLALQRVDDFRAGGRTKGDGYRLLGFVEVFAEITGEPYRAVALDLGVLADLRGIGIDL